MTHIYAATRAKCVIALEPDFVAYQILLKNAELNPSIPISVFHSCVSSREESASMHGYAQPGDSASMTNVLSNNHNGVLLDANTDSVQCRAASKLFQDFGVPQNSKVFIKIDTEGFEQVVVPALHTLLQTLTVRPTLFISMHIGHRNPTEVERKAFVDTLALYHSLFVVEFNVYGQRDEHSNIKRLESPPHPEELCTYCDYVATDDEDASNLILTT